MLQESQQVSQPQTLSDLTRRRIERLVLVPTDEKTPLEIKPEELKLAVSHLLTQVGERKDIDFDLKKLGERLNSSERAELINQLPKLLADFNDRGMAAANILTLTASFSEQEKLTLALSVIREGEKLGKTANGLIALSLRDISSVPRNLQASIVLLLNRDRLDEQVKIELLDTLGKVPSLQEPGVQLLNKIARDKDNSIGVRAAAAQSLIRQDDPNGIKLVGEMLNSNLSDFDNSRILMRTLGAKPSTEACELLVEVATSKTNYDTNRMVALGVLRDVYRKEAGFQQVVEETGQKILADAGNPALVRAQGLGLIDGNKVDTKMLLQLARSDDLIVSVTGQSILLNRDHVAYTVEDKDHLVSSLRAGIRDEPPEQRLSDLAQRRRAVAALLEIGPDSIEPLLQAMQEDGRRGARVRHSVTAVLESNPELAKQFGETVQNLAAQLEQRNAQNTAFVGAYAAALTLCQTEAYELNHPTRVSPSMLIQTVGNKLRLLDAPTLSNTGDYLEQSKKVLNQSTPPTGPLAVVLLPRDDWNGAFSDNQAMIDDVHRQGKTVLVFSDRTDTDMVQIGQKVAQARSRLGVNGKELVSRAMHATREHGVLDSGQDEKALLQISDERKFASLTESEKRSLSALVAPGATVVFIACSSGLTEDLSSETSAARPADSLAAMFRRLFPHAGPIFAPQAPTNLRELVWDDGGTVTGAVFSVGATTRH